MVEFMEQIHYVINALSRNHALLFMIETKTICLEMCKESYVEDHESSHIHVYKNCEISTFKDFYRHDDFLFKRTKLFSPKSFCFYGFCFGST